LELPRCIICNGPAMKALFNESPLEFFFLDQKIYNPNGLVPEGYKVLPLCDNCYPLLKKGQSFIKAHLNFVISPKGGGPRLSFWLIPNVGDPAKANRTFIGIESGDLKFRDLTSLCEELELAQELLSNDISDDPDIAQSLLTFNVLFYNVDRNGKMRILGSSEGIYPSRLKELSNISRELAKKYPYFLMKPNKIRFSFPLLIDFWKRGKGSGWQKDLAELLAKIFIGSRVEESYIYSILIEHLRASVIGSEVRRGQSELKEISTQTLKAMLIVEYLQMSNVLNQSISGQHLGITYLNHPMVDELRKFLNSHTSFIKSGTQRALCCVGVAFGIALVEQERSIGSTSLWSRLNRLQLDVERMNQLFPLVVDKLRQYKIRHYDDLIAYIAANELSNLDLEEAKRINNDLLNLTFAVGLGEGYIIASKKWEKET